MSTDTAVHAIAKYVALQQMLCSALASEFEQYRKEHITGAKPKKGSIRINDDEWLFQKHGNGVMFTRTRDHCIVDPDDHMTTHPSVVDAGRLLQYFESFAILSLLHENQQISVQEYEDIERLLHKLASEGVLRSVDGLARCYCLAVPQTSSDR